MTEQPNTLYTALIEQLKHLEEKREALTAKGLPVPTPQSVMMPIPNKLIKDEDKHVCEFMAKVGWINRSPELGLQVQMEAGKPIHLVDGSTSKVIEVVFNVDENTDIPAIEAFLNKAE